MKKIINNNKKVIPAAVIILVLFSIMWFGFSLFKPDKVYELDNYLEYISDTDNGLVRTKYIKGLKITMKYLPSSYLAYKEYADESNGDFNKLREDYIQTKTFLLSIGPDERKQEGGDIMYNGIQQYQQYADRMLSMNFMMQDYITLQTDKDSYKPVLSSLENVYSLQHHRNIILVFSPQELPEELNQAAYYKLTYEDDLFNIGINHFFFSKEDIAKSEQIRIDTNLLTARK